MENNNYKLTKILYAFKWVLFALCSATFFLLVIGIVNNYSFAIDSYANDIFVNVKSIVLTNIVLIITNSIYIIPFVIILMLLICKNKKLAILFLINYLFVIALNVLFKNTIARQRPDNMLIEESGFSFPSGHTMIITAVCGYAIYLINHFSVKNKTLYTILLILWITLVLLSRVYLGVHYITDIVGGFSVALIQVVLMSTVTKYIK